MRIIFLNAIAGDNWGGIEKWMLTLAQELGARGHRISSIAEPDSLWLRTCQSAGIKCFPLHMGADSNPLLVAAIARHFRSEEADIACVKMLKGIRLAGLAARLCGRRRPAVICHAGDSAMKTGLLPRLTYAHLCDHYIAPSQQVRRDLLPYGYFGPDDVTTIYNGVTVPPINSAERDAVRRELGIEDATVAITTSRLHPLKGHSYLLDALAKVSSKVPRLRLLIVGDGRERQGLEQLTRDLNLTGVVTFLGFRDDVPRLVSASDIFVLPSLREGLPYTGLEAMALGKPVIATAIDGVTELVRDGETGRLVPPRDPVALAAAMEDLLASPGRAAAMGEAGRHRIESDFSLSAMVDQVESVFKKFSPKRRDERTEVGL